jgi:hypothetical protein
MIFIPVVRNAGSLGLARQNAIGPPQFIVPKNGGEVNEEYIQIVKNWTMQPFLIGEF